VILEAAYANGQLAALQRYKLGWPAPTDATVAGSAVLRERAPTSTSPNAQANLTPPTTPQSMSQIFDAHEQGKTRTEPRRKLSAEDLCTSCRRVKHYGPCDQPRKIPMKAADFNIGMRGDDPSVGDNPSTSPHYHAATTADSSLGRARDAQPADVQAQTAFADLFRHLGISNAADEPGRMSGGLNKVAITLMELGLGTSAAVPAAVAGVHDRSAKSALGAGLGGLAGGALGGIAGITLDELGLRGAAPLGYLGGTALGALAGRHVAKHANVDTEHARRHALLFKMYGVDLGKRAGWQMWGTDGHSMHEQRGPSVNPYEERLTIKSPPLGWGDEGPQRIERAFDQIDGAVDSTGIEDASKGAPQGGPAVLG
jgi:hypothetical protein